MSPSLRILLWVSFITVTLIALVVVAIGVVIALQDNPVLYRQIILRLNTAEAAIMQRIEDPSVLVNRLYWRVIQKEAESRQVRAAIISAEGKAVVEVGVNAAEPLPVFAVPIKTTGSDTAQALTLTDAKGKSWLYTMRSLNDGQFLMVALPRPTLPLRTIFSDEVLRPFLQAAGIAMLLALILSLALGHWISKPLQRMAHSARTMANGQYQPIPTAGPKEVVQLGEAFNEMAHQVQSSQQSQREFIANVSHELKTPITSIQGFAQAIIDGTAQTPEALKQSAGVIYSEAGRMHRLVMDLLVLARLDAGTADLQRMRVDMLGLLRAVIEKFSLQAKTAQVQLTAQLSDLPVIIGDGDRIAQVFTNLVDNALKYTPSGGQVLIGTQTGQDMVTVWITDSGPGIAAEDQKRIFERFYQIDKSRRGGAGRGVGLGLAIAAQIVQAHQGQIWVESQQGSGSTFFVRLPIHLLADPTEADHHYGA